MQPTKHSWIQEPSVSNGNAFLRDVLDGLSRSPKTLPCKYFYDSRGSQLFDRICDLPEYYPTRTEIKILKDCARDFAETIGEDSWMIEYGSGSSLKTPLVLGALERPRGYTPIDISEDYLRRSSAWIQECFPEVRVTPIHADYTKRPALPNEVQQHPNRVIFFPGSTLGNFSPEETLPFLIQMREQCHPRGYILLGIDLQKEADVLESAYDDSQGVTAEFNLNLLRRINRELGADFQPDQFAHLAFYNEQAGRVEMHLVSRGKQTVRLAGREIRFENNETIHTESSYKYDLGDFSRLAEKAGLEVRQIRTDERRWFAVLLLQPIPNTFKP